MWCSLHLVLRKHEFRNTGTKHPDVGLHLPSSLAFPRLLGETFPWFGSGLGPAQWVRSISVIKRQHSIRESRVEAGGFSGHGTAQGLGGHHGACYHALGKPEM